MRGSIASDTVELDHHQYFLLMRPPPPDVSS